MGRYRCPNCGRERPDPDVAATSVRLEGMTRLAGGAAHAGRARSRSGCPLPGLYNVYNAHRGRGRGAASSASPLATVGAALEGFGGAFGRVETIPVDGRERLDPAGQEPGRRERGAAHAHARGRRARPLARAQRQDRRRPRRVLDLGCRLRAARRPRAARDLLRHARRGDGAAPEVRRASTPSSRSTATSGARSTRPWPADRGRPLFALPTYTALLELRDLLVAPRPAPSGGRQ